VILAAATDLFAKGDGELPSVASIAARAGLAKGTVYLYFPTRETIFATLLLDGWNEVLHLVEEIFASSTILAEDAGERFLAAYVAHLHDNGNLLRLDTSRPLLEQNLTPETLAASRQTFHEGLAKCGAVIDWKLGLTSGRGFAVLNRTHALTCGLWRQAGVRLADGAAKVSASDFSSELAEALREYWRGALATR